MFLKSEMCSRDLNYVKYSFVLVNWNLFSYNEKCFRIEMCLTRVGHRKSLASIWIFFAFCCCSFWFFVPTKSHNEQCDAQMETSTKDQNMQQKAITSNKRHLPVLVFEIELLLSQKQKKSNEGQ